MLCWSSNIKVSIRLKSQWSNALCWIRMTQIHWNASPVGRFFGEHNHKSSTHSNCRNLTILVVSRSASATFLELSANTCSIDSVVRSVASWCSFGWYQVAQHHLHHTLLLLYLICASPLFITILEFPLWHSLPKQQKALSSNGNNFD